MTVGELRKVIERLDDTVTVSVYRETGNSMDFFDVIDAEVKKGMTKRVGREAKAAFEFNDVGPETHLFISIEEA